MATPLVQSNVNWAADGRPGTVTTYYQPGVHSFTLNGVDYDAAGNPISNGVLGASTTATPPASAPTVDPNAAAYYGTQIDRVNNQIGQLDPQLSVGRQN